MISNPNEGWRRGGERERRGVRMAFLIDRVSMSMPPPLPRKNKTIKSRKQCAAPIPNKSTSEHQHRHIHIYSNSIVAGGFPVISYPTLATPTTSFAILAPTLFNHPTEKSSKTSAVMKSVVCTARNQMTSPCSL